MMSNAQLYLAIGVPLLFNALTTSLLLLFIQARLDGMEKVWRSELHRVEEVLDARLKHLEERAR